MLPIPENSGELTFKHIILLLIRATRFLLSKWKLLLAVGLIGGITGIVYVWMQDASYKAVLSFSTEEDRNVSGGSLAGLAAQFGLDLGSTSNVFSGDNILPLIQSHKIMQSALLAVKTINGKPKSLLNIYLDAGKSEKDLLHPNPKDVKFPEGQDPATFSRLQDSTLFELIEGINKISLRADRPDKKIAIFQVACTSGDENFSKFFVDELIEKVTDFYIESKTRRARQTVEILQKTADSLRNVYNEALTGRASLADANINPAFQGPVVGIQKKQTDITVSSAAYGEVVKNLEIAKYNLLKATPLITVIDDPVLPLKKIKTGRLLGAIVGGFIGGLLGIIYLFFSQVMRGIKEEEAAKKEAPVA